MNDNTLLISDDLSLQALGELAFSMVCRRDFQAPGFALVRLGPSETSTGQRQKMIAIKEIFSQLFFKQCGKTIGWFNLNRFDQSNTTKLHRDGAPNESLLILGYEPSEVESIISMADYSKCAHEMGITPEEFLHTHNPMYEKGMEALKPYVQNVSDFDPSTSQILIINNSMCNYQTENSQWQGVLHGARVQANGSSRIINSTCVFAKHPHEPERISETDVQRFLSDADVKSY